MTREDIDNIISIICPNDEDFEKPIISPAYLKKELETLALEQAPPKQDCKKCKHYANDNETCLECEYDGITRGYTRYEQELSGDLISRQAVLEQTYNWSKDEFLRVTNPFDYLRKRIMDLPSVNPQEPKTGHWIEGEVWEDTDGGWGRWQKCSVCRQSKHHKTNYCPNCGAKMVEQERSDKE